MSRPPKTIRLSMDARDRLILLKRFTKIQTWNVLCRWALCRSLAEPSAPSPGPRSPASNLEMSWHVLGGPTGDLLWAVTRQRSLELGLAADDHAVAEQVRLHIHRGIGLLASGEVRTIEGLLRLGARDLAGAQEVDIEGAPEPARP